MDLIGPMPRSKDGNEWIVTWVDRTLKTIVAAAAAHKHTSAEDLARLTFKEICYQFGLPQNLTMDNDVRFVSLEDDVKNDDDNVCNDLTSQLVVLHERGED